MNFQLENLENGLCRRNSKILTFSTVENVITFRSLSAIGTASSKGLLTFEIRKVLDRS